MGLEPWIRTCIRPAGVARRGEDRYGTPGPPRNSIFIRVLTYATQNRIVSQNKQRTLCLWILCVGTTSLLACKTTARTQIGSRRCSSDYRHTLASEASRLQRRRLNRWQPGPRIARQSGAMPRLARSASAARPPVDPGVPPASSTDCDREVLGLRMLIDEPLASGALGAGADFVVVGIGRLKPDASWLAGVMERCMPRPMEFRHAQKRTVESRTRPRFEDRPRM